MIHYNETTDTYTLIIAGAIVTFPNIKSMIDFAQKHYNINLLETLN